MGIKERKNREKENLRKLIMASAHELLKKEGLAGLTMRSIANHIEYSQSKIYEFFESKDRLCEALCQELCEKHLMLLLEVSDKVNPEKYLTDLIMKTMEFHGLYPHSDTLFTYVCFGPQRCQIPKAFLKIEKLFVNAIKNLKSPYIKTETEVLASLDTIRCIFIGIATLINTETSFQGRTRALNIANNSINILLRGWRG